MNDRNMDSERRNRIIQYILDVAGTGKDVVYVLPSYTMAEAAVSAIKAKDKEEGRYSRYMRTELFDNYSTAKIRFISMTTPGVNMTMMTVLGFSGEVVFDPVAIQRYLERWDREITRWDDQDW